MLDLNAIGERRFSSLALDTIDCDTAKDSAQMESLLRCICQLLGVDASAVYEDDVVGMIEVAIQLANELDQELQTARQRIAELEAELDGLRKEANDAD